MALPQDEWHVVFFRPPMRIPAGAFSTTLLAIIPLFCGLFASAGPVGAQIIATVAGDGTAGYSGDGGPATSASLHNPVAVAVDSAGNFYIAEELGNRIRKVSGGTIATVAGNGTAGFSGDGGPATSASLGNPYGVAVDSAGSLYIADTFNNRIRRVSGGTITTVAGNGTPGYSGDGGPAISAELNQPFGIAVDSAGNLYIADSQNNVIRKVSDGTITTVAGNGTAGFSGDGGPARSASLYSPYAVAIDSAGNLFIADAGNWRIREVSGGAIATVAGGGNHLGDGGPATGASFSSPWGVAVDSAGNNLYIADFFNRIRKVSGGTISTVAGNGNPGFSGDGGPATSALLAGPWGVALDSAGNLFIADSGNERIREVLAQSAPAPSVTSAGVVNAASFQSGAVAPGEIISIFGSGIGPATGALWQIVNGMAPTTLAQTRVLFGGTPAPLIYVSAKQINAVVPYVVAGQSTVSMQVSYQGSLSNSVSLNVAATAPALFTVASSGSGGGAILNQDYSLNTAANPAAAGSVVQIFATGEGVTTPPNTDGKLNNQPLGPTFPMPAAQVSATIGGQPANVLFAGTAPGGVAGFLQVDAVVPSGLPAGPVPILLKVGNASSPAGVTVAVQGEHVQQFSLTVTEAGTGAGTVVSSPAGINCGAACTANFTAGTVVTLSASPSSESTFAGWSGACSGTGSCTVTLSSNQAAAATFNLTSSTGNGITIGSVSASSPIPLTVLQIGASGVSAANPVTLQFSNRAGFSATEQAVRVQSDGTVIAGVPLYVDPGTGQIGPGTVSLVLTQGTQSSAPISLAIQDLPPLSAYGTQLGQISDGFLVFEALLHAERLNEFQAAQQLVGASVDTSSAQTTMEDLLSAPILARADVDSVMANNGTVIGWGSLADGTHLQFDSTQLDVMDRIIAVYLTQQFLSSGGDSRPSNRLLKSPVSWHGNSVHPRFNFGSMAELATCLGSVSTACFMEAQEAVQSSPNAADTSTAWLSSSEATLKLAGAEQAAGVPGLALGYVHFAAAVDSLFHATSDVAACLGSFGCDSADQEAIKYEITGARAEIISSFTATVSQVPVILGLEAAEQATVGLVAQGMQSVVKIARAGSSGGIAAADSADVSLVSPSTLPQLSGHVGYVTGTVQNTGSQGAATSQSSLQLCCFGTSQLGIASLADPQGSYALLAPIGVAGTNYAGLSMSALDPLSGASFGSETVDLSGLNTTAATVAPTLSISNSGGVYPYTYAGAPNAVIATGTDSVTLSGCTPSPYDTQVQESASSTQLTASAPLYIDGSSFSGNLTIGTITVTTNTPPLTCTIDGITSPVQGGTTTQTEPGGTTPISGTSDGHLLTFSQATQNLICAGMTTCSVGGTVSVLASNVIVTLNINSSIAVAGSVTTVTEFLTLTQQ